MKRYIKASLNSDLWSVSVSSINGGSGKALTQKLQSLLFEVPVDRYLLCLMGRGHSTGYYKVDSDNIKWLYTNELYKISENYWLDTDNSFIVLPAKFKPSERINYDDDVVVVYEVSDTEDKIYSGLEDYEPMKREDWKYCEELGVYYLKDYISRKTYIKWKIR